MSEMVYDEAKCILACEHIARGIVRPILAKYSDPRSRAAALKPDGSIVTEADPEIESAIRAYLGSTFPTHGIIGEEGDATNPEARFVWLLDPIDGTESFHARLPFFGSLIGLVEQHAGRRTPLLGAVYVPEHDVLAIGNGTITTIDGVKVRMDSSPDLVLERLRMIVGDIASLGEQPVERITRLAKLAAEFRSAKTWGDCLGVIDMLQGRVHARIEAGLGIEDVVPFGPIFEGAGGCVTDWSGRSISEVISELPSLDDKRHAFEFVASANSDLHRRLLGSLSA
ncbi:MAG: inositol monophosphatase family protein [Isosphaeraceae bacterium]|nr:inositol monophosphatase family protein [Isosphaeraceae bacterium]